MVIYWLDKLFENIEVITEYVQFAWEVVNLCTFVCEEALQTLMFAVSSALNYGRADYAQAILDTAVDEVIEVYLGYAFVLGTFLFPGLVGYVTYILDVLYFVSHAKEVAGQVESMPGMRTYPGLTRYGRFF